MWGIANARIQEVVGAQLSCANIHIVEQSFQCSFGSPARFFEEAGVVGMRVVRGMPVSDSLWKSPEGVQVLVPR